MEWQREIDDVGFKDKDPEESIAGTFCFSAEDGEDDHDRSLMQSVSHGTASEATRPRAKTPAKRASGALGWTRGRTQKRAGVIGRATIWRRRRQPQRAAFPPAVKQGNVCLAS